MDIDSDMAVSMNLEGPCKGSYRAALKGLAVYNRQVKLFLMRIS